MQEAYDEWAEQYDNDEGIDAGLSVGRMGEWHGPDDDLARLLSILSGA